MLAFLRLWPHPAEPATDQGVSTAAAWITITLSESMPPNPAKIAMVGAAVAGVYALVGAVLAWMLPEPKEGEH